MLAALLGDDVEPSGRYLAEVIYGANDGIVTTFAVVAGVAAAPLASRIPSVHGSCNSSVTSSSSANSGRLDVHRIR